MASEAGPGAMTTAGQAIKHGVTLQTYLSAPICKAACLPAGVAMSCLVKQHNAGHGLCNAGPLYIIYLG